MKNKWFNLLFIVLILEVIVLGHHLYKQYNQPDFLMTIHKEYWHQLSQDEKEFIVDSLYRYSKSINPEWGERIPYFYENKGIYSILFVQGRIESVPKKKEGQNALPMQNL